MNFRTRIERLEREARRREIESRPPRPILFKVVYADGSPFAEFIVNDPAACNRGPGMMKSWKR